MQCVVAFFKPPHAPAREINASIPALRTSCTRHVGACICFRRAEPDYRSTGSSSLVADGAEVRVLLYQHPLSQYRTWDSARLGLRHSLFQYRDIAERIRVAPGSSYLSTGHRIATPRALAFRRSVPDSA
eukprot:1013282-Rhodomonas_salina.2